MRGFWLSMYGIQTCVDDGARFAHVPDPYFNVPGISGPGQCGTSSTVPAIELILPLSQYCSPGGTGLVGSYNSPQGRNWYDGLEVTLTKRANRGLTLNLSYTLSKTINGDRYLNGWPYQDPVQVHWIAGTDRTHILSATSVYDLPIGRNGLFWTNPSHPVGLLINNWQMSSVFNAQSGTPVPLNTGLWYNCPGQSFRPGGGTSVRQGAPVQHRKLFAMLAGHSEMRSDESVGSHDRGAEPYYTEP